MSNILLTFLSIVFAFIGLGFLVLVHELGHFLAAKTSGVGVAEFSLGFGKKLFGFKKGETEYKVSAIPLGGYVKLMGLEEKCDDPEKSYMKKPKLIRLKILAAGVVFNFVFALVALTLVNIHGVKQLKLKVNPAKDMPAAEVLVVGDEIKKINGIEVTTWEGIISELKRYQDGKPITLVIMRNGHEKEVSINPVKVETEDEFGGKVEKWVLGIAPTGEVFFAPGMPPAKAFLESVKFCGNAYVMTYVFIGKLFVKKADAKKGLGGPVLIISLLTASAKDSFFSFFFFLAVLSLMLGIMNSMPIPILDGGHIMFLGIEVIRGKPLKNETMNFIQSIFFWLLILLMIFTVYLDIGRFMK